MAEAQGFEALAEALDALSHPVRLALLAELQSAKIQSEIEVRHAPESEAKPRPLARQTVRSHLGRLLEQGLIQEGPTERSFGRTTQYVADHQVVFTLSEQLRELAKLQPEDSPSRPTEDATEPAPNEPDRGPNLLLVKGAREGHVFEIDPHEEGQWLIGRRRDADVVLDYDPYVSEENSVLAFDEKEFRLRDLPASRNGTRVNFDPLGPEETRPLRHGDVIGVGRSRLVFQQGTGEGL